MSCIAERTDHASLADGSDDADARVVGKHAQPAGFEAQHVSEVGNDRSSVADDDHALTCMMACDFGDHGTHPLDPSRRRFAEVERSILADLDRYLDKPVVDAHVVANL